MGRLTARRKVRIGVNQRSVWQLLGMEDPSKKRRPHIKVSGAPDVPRKKNKKRRKAKRPRQV